MGKHHGDEHVTQPITTAQVQEALTPRPDSPPDSEETKRAHAFLGSDVRAVVGARVQTIHITDYEESSQVYNGVAQRAGKSLDTGDPILHQEAVTGLRRYPYLAEPNYSFQFVLPGEDESVLVNLARHNQPNFEDQPAPVDAGGAEQGHN